MTSQKTLVTTVTVTMTTTTTPPLLEVDNVSDPQASPKRINNSQASFQRHFIYEPPPKLSPETKIQEEEQQHGFLKWTARNKNEEQHQYEEQKHLRWPSEDNKSAYSKWFSGSHIHNSNNDNNTVSRRVISISGNKSRNCANSISGNNDNCNHYNTNYIKDYGHSSREQFMDHNFIGSMLPTSPSPLSMMVQRGEEGESEELSCISGRGLKYPPPRRDSDGHILGSANYSAPSPPERDMTLPYSSETLAWKNEKKLSPLLCEPHKEIFDLDRYISSNSAVSSSAASATSIPIWKDDSDIVNEKHSLSGSGYLSKETNKSNSKALCNPSTSTPYIVKPKPFYNTSTQTEEIEVAYDGQLQFKCEEKHCVSPLISPMGSNFRINSDQTHLEKATQVQLPKKPFSDSGLVTLEQLKSSNYQEFIPASAPLLRKLTEEYYQMNINEDNKDELRNDQQANLDIDEHAMNIDNFDSYVKNAITNNTEQELPFMIKTPINEPLQSCMDKLHNQTSVNDSDGNIGEQMHPYINLKMDDITISNFNENDGNIYDYENQLKPCNKQSVYAHKPQSQFSMNIKFDEQGFSVEEPRPKPFGAIKKDSLNTIESDMSYLLPQSYKGNPINMSSLNTSGSQSKMSKNVKSCFTVKENQLQSYRTEENIIEPDYMNINQQVGDCNIPKKFDSTDDVFIEPKEFLKQIKGDSRSSCQKQGVSVGPLEMSDRVKTGSPDYFMVQSMRTSSLNLKSGVESSSEKLLTPIKEGNFENSCIRHGFNVKSVLNEKDNPEATVSQDASSRLVKNRYSLSDDTLLNQPKENIFKQCTESSLKSSECRYGTKFENHLNYEKETKSPLLLKKYASSSDILLGQTADKNQPINSTNSGGIYENIFNQTRENIFMQKTISKNLENRYGLPPEEIENETKRNHKPELAVSNYFHLGSVSDVLHTPYVAPHESKSVMPSSLSETPKQTAEREKSTNSLKQSLNTKKCSSAVQTFGTLDNASVTFENQRYIQHGRSESLPIDYTYESPSLQLRSYYSCTDVNKEKPSEPKLIYGVSDYMDMSGRHCTDWPQINSRITGNTRVSSGFVPTNTKKKKKKRTSSCTGYRIHANFESEEDPPPQLPPRAYRNMSESSESLNWMYESLRHRRSYANELRKQARRLNICKPLANITEQHVTDINQTIDSKNSFDNINVNAAEKKRGKERKEEQKMTNENNTKDETKKRNFNYLNPNDINVSINQDVKSNLKINDNDLTSFTNLDKVKCHQVTEDNINITKHVSLITEHSSNNEYFPIINKCDSDDIIMSNVNQQSLNIDEQYLNTIESQSTITNKVLSLPNNTSEKCKHLQITDIDDIKGNCESGVSTNKYDTDITNISSKTVDSVLQSEHNLNDSFQPNRLITQQESQIINEDFNMDKANQIYLNESCSLTNNDINDITNVDVNVNLKKCILHMNENSENINEKNISGKKEIVHVERLPDSSKSSSPQSMQSVTSPSSQPDFFMPSPTFQHSILKMSSLESRVRFQYRSSSEQCLSSTGSCDDQMNLPLNVSLGNIPNEDAGFTSAVDTQPNDISVKQRIHFFEYDSNGELVRERIPPPVPAKPTSLVFRKKFLKEEGFSSTQPNTETDPSAAAAENNFNFLIENPPESSAYITNTPEEKSEQENNKMEYIQYNITENMDIITTAAQACLMLPKAEEERNNSEYFQPSHVFQNDYINKDVLIRKKDALRDSLKRKLDVLSEAKLNVETEIQDIDTMKKNVCSQFESACPNINERRKLIDFFKDREMCQVLLSKLKVRITRLENEMEETKPSHDLIDKLSKLKTQYSEAEQLSSDIDARQNSLVKLLEKYLTPSNLLDFNYLLMMRPRLVSEMFELNEKISSGGQKLLELERVPLNE